jgi:hypothetical protein
LGRKDLETQVLHALSANLRGDLEKEFGRVELDRCFGKGGRSFHFQFGSGGQRKKTGQIKFRSFSSGHGLDGDPADKGDGFLGRNALGQTRKNQQRKPCGREEALG